MPYGIILEISGDYALFQTNRQGALPGRKRPLPDSMFADVSQRPASREVDQKPIRRQAFNCVLTMPFLLWHFSPGDKIENCSAQFLAVCSLISAAPKN
jgi:hypothetical protein